MRPSNYFSDLILEAQKLIKPLPLVSPSENATTVGCTLQSKYDPIYPGICIDLACGIGFCAEAAAIANMIKDSETVMTYIAAVSKRGILAPCGRCLGMMVPVSEQNDKTLGAISETEAISMNELLPDHW